VIGADERLGKLGRSAASRIRAPRAVKSAESFWATEAVKPVSWLRGPCERPAHLPGDWRWSELRGFGRPKREGAHREGNLAMREGADRLMLGQPSDGTCARQIHQPGNRLTKA